MVAPAVARGVHAHGEKVALFGVQPVARRHGVGQARELGPGGSDTGSMVLLSGVEGIHRRGGAVQVVVEQSRQRRPSVRLGIHGGRQLGRVRPQQVVHAVPPRSAELDEVSSGEQAE